MPDEADSAALRLIEEVRAEVRETHHHLINRFDRMERLFDRIKASLGDQERILTSMITKS